MEKDDFKKVRAFLKDLTPIEYRYLELTMQVVGGIQMIINRYKLSKERFCELFKINPKIYNKYTKGDFSYSLDDMARIDAIYHLLETERIQKEEIIKVNVEGEKKDE